MTTLLLLLFISLAGIGFMIGRKLTLIRNGVIINTETGSILVPDLETIQYALSKSAKKGGYIMTVTMVRFYVQSENLLKNTYNKLNTLIKNLKNKKGSTEDKKEASKFLKMISDYKYKVRSIKKHIEEEEKEK